MNQTFNLPVSLRVRGTAQEVFSAWITPSLAESWLCDRMEGEWKANSAVYWWYGDNRQEIRVIRFEKNAVLGFLWNAYGSQPETEVTLEFESLDGEVRVKVCEASWALSLDNVKIALDHACGWENTLCRLKLWVEKKVNLNS